MNRRNKNSPAGWLLLLLWIPLSALACFFAYDDADADDAEDALFLRGAWRPATSSGPGLPPGLERNSYPAHHQVLIPTRPDFRPGVTRHRLPSATAPVLRRADYTHLVRHQLLRIPDTLDDA